MIEVAFLVLFCICILAVQNWKHGFTLCVLMALAQDPMRKLLPGQPVVLVVFVAAVFLATCLGAMHARVNLAPADIMGWKRNVGTPFKFFLIVMLLQTFLSLLRFNSPVMTGIGLMSYLAPIPAIVVAYRFALHRREAGIRKWMLFYIVVASCALTTVYLEFSGLRWRIFGEVGDGVFISGAGAYYKGNSGTFRAAEIAAWHAATVACFAFIVFWGRRFSPPKVAVALVFVAFLLGIGALTGRRKMVIEIAIFMATYFCLISWFRRRSGKLFVMMAFLGLLAYTSAIGIMNPDPGDGSWASERVSKTTGNTFGKYTERASTVFEDTPRRVKEMGFLPVRFAVEQYGWLGAGVGVGSQGAQHFGHELGGASEGGLGKLTVELGVPGLIVVFWFLISFGRFVWRALDALERRSPAHANLAYGLVAFVLANVAAFSVATQAYGDPFILLTLGWAVGCLLAMPVLAEASVARPVEARARKREAVPALALELRANQELVKRLRMEWES